MGGRTMPTECEHGHTVDWGDFGDPEQPYGGATPCPHCETQRGLRGELLALRKRLGRMHSKRDAARRKITELEELRRQERARHRRMQAERDHALLALTSIALECAKPGAVARAALDTIRADSTSDPLFEDGPVS
ncbi:MAG: hypothetical protein AAGA90_23265 [Actinomycetota bacterium]